MAGKAQMSRPKDDVRRDSNWQMKNERKFCFLKRTFFFGKFDVKVKEWKSLFTTNQIIDRKVGLT